MNEAPKVVDLDRETIKEGLREGAFVLVDVREPHEFAAGHIPGAVSHPLSSFDPSVLPEGKRIVFSCAAGVRSARALEFAELLAKKAPLALGTAKLVINQCSNVDTETGRNFERIAQSVLKLTEDHKEGSTAFVEKRPPRFKGR